MEGDDVEEEGLAENFVVGGFVCRRGEHVWGRGGVGGAGDAVGREERVALIWVCGGGAGGQVVELLWQTRYREILSKARIGLGCVSRPSRTYL